MRTISSIKQMQKFSNRQREGGRTIALVPTMGYLHKGHLSLMVEGRKRADILIISIFVNPTQFGKGEDYQEYPRDLTRDKKLAREAGVDIIFAPKTSLMYPPDYQTWVEVREVTRNLCGASRPGHFQGVTTVVAKLFNIIKPHIALFGEKDFQQLVTIKRMAADLNFDIKILGMPTVRENDGLAMSSRNTYLSPRERESALSLSRSLRRARELVSSGERNTTRVIEEIKGIIGKEKLINIDYIKICDTDNLKELKKIDRKAVMALAAKLGQTRLIDNCILKP
ncbi:MAG: pantoate--beta-alanine ligase [Deltaproteobacteria bacterium]|nr:MAG: pantoate--beta-alanine ligase [Deltaproteobacteria bacterium]